jgi:hypothetical protein
MVTLLVLGLLTACSPKPLPVVAITLRSGEPTLVLVTCVGRSSKLGLYETGSDPGQTVDMLVRWFVHGDASTEIIEIAVFGQPPAGWQPEAIEDDELLDDLRDGVTYGANGWGMGRSTQVDFTTADLEALEDGYVLSTDGDGRRQTMKYDEFVRQARQERGTCSDTSPAVRTGVRAPPAP